MELVYAKHLLMWLSGFPVLEMAQAHWSSGVVPCVSVVSPPRARALPTGPGFVCGWTGERKGASATR